LIFKNSNSTASRPFSIAPRCTSPGDQRRRRPNGCGKSNIADAIRWVLGEQSPKQLRGEKMEDLIFSGSESRHPLGMAEVSLTVELTGEELPVPYNTFTEICVTRRLYRSARASTPSTTPPAGCATSASCFSTPASIQAYAVISQGQIGSLVDAHRRTAASCSRRRPGSPSSRSASRPRCASSTPPSRTWCG